MRAWPFLVVVACGARTDLGEPLQADASIDSGRDAAVDAPRDVAIDVPIDVRNDIVPPPLMIPGCADGQREAFLDTKLFPSIAGCAGGFAIAGVLVESPPSCNRAAGDDGANPNGAGCNVADLCQAGWHVCRTANEVAMRIVSLPCAADSPPNSFFTTRQSGPGCLYCATGSDATCNQESCRPGCLQTSSTTNDLFGCGSAGSATTPSCAPLTRSSNNDCSDLPPPWQCPGSNGENEPVVVVKPGPQSGGALCCQD